jgi:isopentenyldiphosphate isomerase
MTSSNNRDIHRITSPAIIYKDGEYLLLRRSLKKKAFPGNGQCRKGEDEDRVRYQK